MVDANSFSSLLGLGRSSAKGATFKSFQKLKKSKILCEERNNYFVELPCPQKPNREQSRETAARSPVGRDLEGTMVKVLIAGDVKGSVPQLLAKVAQYHK